MDDRLWTRIEAGVLDSTWYSTSSAFESISIARGERENVFEIFV